MTQQPDTASPANPHGTVNEAPPKHDIDKIRARAIEFRAGLNRHPGIEEWFGKIEQTETEFLLAEIDRLRALLDDTEGQTDGE